MPQKERIDVLIVTAAEGEDKAVKSVFGESWERVDPIPQLDLYWDKITLKSKKGRPFTVGLVHSDMGTENAGIISTIMLQLLQPSFVTMCGICAGRPGETNIGDVIIANKVFRYDTKSVKRLVDGSVEENFNITTYEIAKSWWQLAGRLEIEGIKIHVGPIATAEVLQRDPKVWDAILKYERKCIGVEMEASVIGHIGHITELRWMVIKGVLDNANPDKNDEYRVQGIKNAAIVLKEFLEEVADQLPKIYEIDGVWTPQNNNTNEPTVNPRNTAPSTLLQAKNEIVPFFDAIRQPELDALEAFCQPDTHGIIQLFTGPGGIGKTRLMIEWINRLKETNTWLPCFLNHNIDPEDQDFKDLIRQDNNLFFVIDYAECRTNLSKILRVLIDASEKKRHMVRVALVARHSGDWWDSLSANNQDISGYLHDRVVELQNVSTRDNRQRLFDEAFQAFASKIGNPDDEVTKTKVYAILDDPVFERVLYIHMAAYAAVVDKSFTAQDLLDVIVSYEKHFWIKFNEGIKGDKAITKFIGETARVIAALTLFGGVSNYEKLKSIIDKSKGPNDEMFPDFLRDFYPPSANSPNKVVGYLEPDILGEYLVFDTLRTLRKQKSPFSDATFLENMFNLTDDFDELQQAFTVLGRIAEREEYKSESTMIMEWLSLTFDEAHINVRALPAISAANSLAEKTAFCPIPDILTNALGKWGSFYLALEFLIPLPHDSIACHKLKLWVAETVAKGLKGKVCLTEEQISVYSMVLSYYGITLLEHGKKKEALEITQEVVEIRRQLATSRPDVFLHDLVKSLNNLGIMLGELDEHEEAMEITSEAVEILRQLTSFHPDVFLYDLAMSLNNLGAILIILGKREEALEAFKEAVDICRTLDKSHPDAFLPGFAKSLINFGKMLSNLGRLKEALEVTTEAVEIRRQLSASRPDAYLPLLATSLYDLGKNLSELNKHKEALEATSEAVEILRKLASFHPDAFLLDLSRSLSNLGIMLSTLGKREEALEATNEAIEKYRILAASRSDAIFPDLARNLHNLGAMLELGEEALEATIEAVEIRRQLAASRPDAFLPDLAMSLNNLGTMLSSLGKREEALDATREAVEKYRTLSASCPDTFLPDLAGSLNNLGLMLRDLGKREEALDATREVVEIRRQLSASRPDAFLPDLASSLKNLGLILSDLEKREEALEAYNEATTIIRPFAKKYPQIYEAQLFYNLLLRILTLRDMGRENEIPPEEMAEFAELAPKYLEAEVDGEEK